MSVSSGEFYRHVFTSKVAILLLTSKSLKLLLQFVELYGLNFKQCNIIFFYHATEIFWGGMLVDWVLVYRGNH